MKRSSKLTRNKPLSSQSTLKRSSKPLPQRSKKTQEIYKVRRKIVSSLLEERPFCEACLIFSFLDGVPRRVNQSVDVHEIVSRGRGGSIIDIPNLLAVCRFPCHARITETTGGEAEYAGLALPSWSTPEMLEEAALRRASLSEGLDPGPPSWWSLTESESFFLSRKHAE